MIEPMPADGCATWSEHLAHQTPAAGRLAQAQLAVSRIAGMETRLAAVTAERDRLRTALHDLIANEFYRQVHDERPNGWGAHLTDAEMERLSGIAGVET